MAQWMIANAPHVSFNHSANIGGDQGGNSISTNFLWSPITSAEYIVYSQSPAIQIEVETYYQLEFWYDSGMPGGSNFKINVYGDWDGDLNTPQAPGVEFVVPPLVGFNGQSHTQVTIVAQSGGSDEAPPGTYDQALANSMVITNLTSTSTLQLDNFSFRKVTGPPVTTPEALTNWHFLGTTNVPAFIPGPGALDFTTYPDQIYFPQGPALNYSITGIPKGSFEFRAANQGWSAALNQYNTKLWVGQIYRLTMDINNDNANPPLDPYNGGLIVDTGGEYQGNSVLAIPITENNGVGTAEWLQTSTSFFGGPQDLTIAMEPGGEALIDNIVLKTVHQTGGDVTNWNLLDDGVIIDTARLDLYWEPDYYSSQQGSVVFDTDDEYMEINQAIDGANIFAGDQFRITLNVSNYNDGQLDGYLYNADGNGFLFGPINSNGFNAFSGIVSQSSLLPPPEKINKISFVTPSGGFEGKIDNMTLEIIGGGKTLSFGEDIKGWSSFKSFTPDFALSVSGQYYTTRLGKLYKHHQEFEKDGSTIVNRNNFYGDDFESSITPILNVQPETIKNFNTLNYEGSQSKIDIRHDDKDYYNLASKDGWYVSNIHTDLQEGSLNEFIEKEGKWFNHIKGLHYQVDPGAFNFQGIGIVDTIGNMNIDGENAPEFTSLTVRGSLIEGDDLWYWTGGIEVEFDIPNNWFYRVRFDFVPTTYSFGNPPVYHDTAWQWIGGMDRFAEGQNTTNTGTLKFDETQFTNVTPWNNDPNNPAWGMAPADYNIEVSIGEQDGVWTETQTQIVQIGSITNLPANTIAMGRSGICYNITDDFVSYEYTIPYHSFGSKPVHEFPQWFSSLYIPNGTGMGHDPYVLFDIIVDSWNYAWGGPLSFGMAAPGNEFVPAGHGILDAPNPHQVGAWDTFDSISFIDTNGNPLTIGSIPSNITS